jgi:hypothetical protein
MNGLRRALRLAMRGGGDRGGLDVRPRSPGTVQPSPPSAERSMVIGPISTPQGRPSEMRMHELRQLIDRGEYRVDTHAVADAIVRRLLGGQVVPQPRPAGEQNA